MKSKETLASLFRKGSHFVLSPLHVRYLSKSSNQTQIQVAFSVPKKRFKRAVDRNLLKRRMREAYRLNKHLLVESLKDKPQRTQIMFVYTKSVALSFQTIQQSMLNFINHYLEDILE